MKRQLISRILKGPPSVIGDYVGPVMITWNHQVISDDHPLPPLWMGKQESAW